MTTKSFRHRNSLLAHADMVPRGERAAAAIGRRASEPNLARGEGAKGLAALLRPGQEVVVVSLSITHATVQSSRPLQPGSRAELQLTGADRRVLRGYICHSTVARLQPLCYEGLIEFDTSDDGDGMGPISDALVACHG